jgi:hypothetical protein
VTDELRDLLRAGLTAERPPPLGDLVATAIRDGRRIRRNRRLGAGAAALVALVLAVLRLGDADVAQRAELGFPVAAATSAWSPGSVPVQRSALAVPPRARTLTVHSGTLRADGMQKKATSAAMLHLLLTLLPPGRTSHFGVSADDDLLVQLYLDDGDGPAMVRVSLGRDAPFGDEPPRGGTATVTIDRTPGDCLRDTVVGAEWPDGTVVRVDVPTCLAFDGVQNPPSRAALTVDQAIRVATDPRWGMTMGAALVDAGAERFAALPVFAG